MAMVDLRPEDIIHKSYMNRLLIEIVDQPVLSQSPALKAVLVLLCSDILIVFQLTWILMSLKAHMKKPCAIIFYKHFTPLGLK